LRTKSRRVIILSMDKRSMLIILER
jgi:hypothetical protein